MRELSVIVVSFNTRALLRQCLRSLYDSLGLLDAEVIVHDNASSDGSAQMVAEEFPQAILQAGSHNLGFAAANNRALAVAQGEKVLFLNPDTVVLGDSVRRLATFLDEHPDVGIAGGRILRPDKQAEHAAFRFPSLWQVFLDFFPINHRLVNSRLNGRYSWQQYNAPFPIDHPLGACMMTRRAVLQNVGAFDEGFFMYCEEVDWCRRVRAAGWAAYFTPEASIIHYGGGSTRQFRGPMYIELFRSRYRYFAKHEGRFFQARARAIVRLGATSLALRALAGRRAPGWQDGSLSDCIKVYWEIFKL